MLWSWNFRTTARPNSVVVLWSWSCSGPVTPPLPAWDTVITGLTVVVCMTWASSQSIWRLAWQGALWRPQVMNQKWGRVCGVSQGREEPGWAEKSPSRGPVRSTAISAPRDLSWSGWTCTHWCFSEPAHWVASPRWKEIVCAFMHFLAFMLCSQWSISFSWISIWWNNLPVCRQNDTISNRGRLGGSGRR